MIISPEILYIIPLAMILASIIILFRARKDNIEDAGLKIAALIAVCGAAMLLFITIYAFNLVCKIFS